MEALDICHKNAINTTTTASMSIHLKREDRREKREKREERREEREKNRHSTGMHKRQLEKDTLDLHRGRQGSKLRGTVSSVELIASCETYSARVCQILAD